MSSVGHEKKLETAKEKKEQADKAFQASDLPTGACCDFFRVVRGGLISRWCLVGDSFEALS